MSDHPYRYTDAHVRANPSLYEELTTQYLEHYTGDFELLLSYRQRLELGEPLTVPMIRAVLNCMRYDAKVSLPEPPQLSNVIEFKLRDDRRRQRHGDRFINLNRREPPAPPTRPRFIDLPTRWHVTHGISSWVTASRVHIIHPNSHFRYDTQEQQFECRLSWLCTPTWSMPRVPIELLTVNDVGALLDAWPGWKRCASCERLSDKMTR